MDFNDTADEAAFRDEVRSWLAANAKYAPQPRPGSIGMNYDVAEARQWQRRLYDAGFAGITWPVEYGGRGLGAIHAAILQDELTRVVTTDHPFRPAIGDAGRLIMHHGTPLQQQQHLAPILRGEQIWCHLLSEPNAGSDLASLTTRAERAGDQFVVNGQKVWTSAGHVADFGLLLARTNPDVPKHHGLTYFIVDMRTPGIDVRPLRQMTGDAHFNEVFLDNVVVPATAVLGEVDKGWTVAHASLANEREYVGNRAATSRRFEQLAGSARQLGISQSPIIRQRLAAQYIREEILRYQWLKVQTAFSQNRPVFSEMSMMKLALSNSIQAATTLGVELLGPAGAVHGPADAAPASVHHEFVGHLAFKIGGGTDNIQKNAIAERLLGLPREPKG